MQVKKLLHKGYLRIKSKILTSIVYPFFNAFLEISGCRYVMLTASINPISNNWGDDVSQVLVLLINPSLRVVIKRYSWNLRKKNDILCIGSIISWMTGPRSIIWGSGVVYPDQKLKYKPTKVLAVRGPLTRQYLIRQGVQCPEIYGDPALLFPRFYNPVVSKRQSGEAVKKYKIGLIPHFRDLDNPIIKQLAQREDILLINVKEIQPWHLFIDNILSCDYICSSSLHGIIVSDAYRIPNTWIEIEDGERKRFAFQDYLSSVNRYQDKGFLVTKETTPEQLMEECSTWKEPIINLDKLMEVCPFK